MFTFNLRKSWRKVFGPWMMAAPPRPQARPSFKPRLEDLEKRIVPAQTWWVDLLSDSGAGMGNQGDLRYCMRSAGDGDTIVFGVGGTISLESSLPVI